MYGHKDGGLVSKYEGMWVGKWVIVDSPAIQQLASAVGLEFEVVTIHVPLWQSASLVHGWFELNLLSLQENSPTTPFRQQFISAWIAVTFSVTLAVAERHASGVASLSEILDAGMTPPATGCVYGLGWMNDWMDG